MVPEILFAAKHVVSIRRLVGIERVGRPFCYDVELFSDDPITAGELLGKKCALNLGDVFGARIIAGMVTRVGRVATNQPTTGRVLHVRIEPQAALLRFAHHCRIFRKETGPQIVQHVLEGAGYGADAVVLPRGSHPKREHVTQLDETDFDFMHRMCEREGLHVLYGTDERDPMKETLRIEDTSTAHKPRGKPLVVIATDGMADDRPAAFHLTIQERRRAGTVTLADYDHEKPDHELQVTTTAGNAVEKSTEIYRAPAGFSDKGEGKTLAQMRLEALRMEALTLSFATNVAWLQVGSAVALDASAGDQVLEVTGSWTVTRLDVFWSTEVRDGRVLVQAIPLSTPVRLSEVTPQPRIAGLDVAFVAGEPGSEIHPDHLGRVRLRFPWDIKGPTDHTSSLPVRVMQPNMPGSMNIPRVGWEQFVAFEDGDPDRPYALGRAYSALNPPPYSLPTNKQVTALRSLSSPGAGGMNCIHMDDAAGGQHFMIQAENAQNVDVGASAVVSTEKNENEKAATQTRHVGANQKVSVGQILVNNVGSQSLHVGGTHTVYTGGHLGVEVGAELVGVGAAFLEKIGNPADGAAALGPQAILAVPGVAGGLVGGGLGMAIGIGGGLLGAGYAAYQANKSGASGWGVAAAFGDGVLDMAGGFLPGANAALGGLKRAGGGHYPWDPEPPKPGPAAAGGGATGGGGGGGATGPGPGHKNEVVKGAYSELIGAALAVGTGGKIVWETQVGEVFSVGASHKVRAVMATKNVGGVSKESSASFDIKAGSKVHFQATAGITTTIGGAYTIKSGTKTSFDAGGALTFKASSMDLKEGKITFEAGGSIVTLSSEGLYVKGSKITIDGNTNVDGEIAH